LPAAVQAAAAAAAAEQRDWVTKPHHYKTIVKNICVPSLKGHWRLLQQTSPEKLKYSDEALALKQTLRAHV
jgi:hypothetical protein